MVGGTEMINSLQDQITCLMEESLTGIRGLFGQSGMNLNGNQPNIAGLIGLLSGQNLNAKQLNNTGVTGGAGVPGLLSGQNWNTSKRVLRVVLVFLARCQERIRMQTNSTMLVLWDCSQDRVLIQSNHPTMLVRWLPPQEAANLLL